MNRAASPVAKYPVAPRLLVAIATIASLACAIVVAWANHARGDDDFSPADSQRIIGTWRGTTESDGDVTFTFTDDGKLSYEFTGGDKDKNYGTYELSGPNVLLYTPHDEVGIEHWSYGFDEAGHLRLKMEQDDPKNEETYTLSRVDQ